MSEPSPPPRDMESESRDADLLYRLRRNPNDLALLKEMLRIREAEGNEGDAAEYRRRICIIDPDDPDIQGKEIGQRVLPEVPEDPQPFREAIRYPWQGRRGRETLVAGIIFFFVGRILGGFVWRYFPIPGLGQLLGLFVLTVPWGATVGLWFRIAQASAQGAREVPEWADFRDFYGSMLIPCVGAICAGLAAFWPFVVTASVGVPTWGLHPLVIIALVATFLGGLFLSPMTLLAYANFETLDSVTRIGFLNRSIRRTLPAYFRIVLSMFLLLVPSIALGATWIFGNILYCLVTTPVWFYSGMVAFRLLGKFYIQNRKALNWFGEVVDTGSSPLPY